MCCVAASRGEMFGAWENNENNTLLPKVSPQNSHTQSSLIKDSGRKLHKFTYIHTWYM